MPRRAVAYVRESTEEQGRGYSPDGQRQAIARYARDHGLELVDEYLDFETGRAVDKRRGFQRLIEDAMARRFEPVLVFHTSRFARNTIEAKRYKKLLRSELGIEALFDRVQDLRRQRTTTLNPGRPSPRYPLRSLARCERCDGRMQDTATGRNGAPRYYCATRRKQHACDQPLAPADRVEEQIADFIADFRPAQAIRDEILRRLAEPAAADTAETAPRRAALDERRRRLRDLYELGDLDRNDYLARRQAVDADLDQLAPGPAPDIDAARRVLDNFSLFWQQEPDPEPRRQLLQHLFERIWIDDKRIVAVRPKRAFVALFLSKAAVGKERERRDSNPRPPA